MSRKPALHEPPHLPPERADEVLAELERVISSPLFRTSRRCQVLLRRIIEHTLAEEVDFLKEKALGVEAFGRAEGYDTSEDPIVRASAAEIRKKLAQYYQEAGHHSETRIELPSGSYLAEFHFVEPKSDAQALQASAAPSKPRLRKRTAIAILTSTCLLVVACLAALNWNRSDIDRLWGPLLKTPGTVLVCVGFQAAYNLRSAQAQDEIQGIVPPSAIAKARRPIREDDLILLRDRYVALDDAICLARIASLLASYRKPYRIRGERTLSFADLRDTPSVLIGAFDNPWTLRTADQLRFTFRKDSEHDTGMVYDRNDPKNTQWKLASYWPDWDVPVDYAIVTRIVDTTTDRPVMIVAGLTQYGTVAAGEFVSNPEYFSEAARRLPADWPKKNLQIVLSVPVVNHISGRPRILATHAWPPPPSQGAPVQ